MKIIIFCKIVFISIFFTNTTAYTQIYRLPNVSIDEGIRTEDFADIPYDISGKIKSAKQEKFEIHSLLGRIKIGNIISLKNCVFDSKSKIIEIQETTYDHHNNSNNSRLDKLSKIIDDYEPSHDNDLMGLLDIIESYNKNNSNDDKNSITELLNVIKNELDSSEDKEKIEKILNRLNYYNENNLNYNYHEQMVSKFTFSEKFIYNNKDKCIEAITYISPKRLSSKHLYKYNDKGKLIMLSRYINENRHSNKEDSLFNDILYLYKYNSAGKLIRTEHKDFSFSKENIYTANYNYNSAGKLISKTFFDEHYIYKYNNGKLVSRTNSDLNEIEKYNSHGDIIEYNIDNDYHVYTYKYEYDNKGNWIERIKFSKNKMDIYPIPCEYLKREIEYY